MAAGEWGITYACKMGNVLIKGFGRKENEAVVSKFLLQIQGDYAIGCTRSGL